MGSPLGPTLANIITTEFETVIVKPLINSGKIVFYKRYVDDTLVLATSPPPPPPPEIEHILSTLSTANQPILVNTNIAQDLLHRRERFLGYIRALTHRAHKICSNDELLKAELSNIASFMPWNGFSRKLNYKKTVNIIQTLNL